MSICDTTRTQQPSFRNVRLNRALLCKWVNVRFVPYRSVLKKPQGLPPPEPPKRAKEPKASKAQPVRRPVRTTKPINKGNSSTTVGAIGTAVATPASPERTAKPDN